MAAATRWLGFLRADTRRDHIRARRALILCVSMQDQSPTVRAIIGALFVVWITIFVLALFDALPGF